MGGGGRPLAALVLTNWPGTVGLALALSLVPPANGIDVKELAPFVEALESTEFAPASFRWEGTRRALIEAEARAG